MLIAKLCRTRGEMAAASQMTALRQGRIERVASHDGGDGADQLGFESGETASGRSASMAISRRLSTAARMVAIHRVNHR